MSVNAFVNQRNKNKQNNMKDCEKHITAIIKTFERPHCCIKLIDSIREYYPDMHIVVADDSQMPHIIDDVEYCVLPFDSGLSYGRNFLVRKVKTKYLLLLDDDYVFSSQTDLSIPFNILENNKEIDLVGGRWHKNSYIAGTLEYENGDIIHYYNKHRSILNGYKIYDRTQNFFVAKTDVIKNNPWDNDLKVNEHTDFFYRNKGKITITSVPEFVILHYHDYHDDHELLYREYRMKRAPLYSDIFLRKNNAKNLITIIKNWHKVSKSIITIDRKISLSKKYENTFYIQKENKIKGKFIRLDRKISLNESNKNKVWILSSARSGSTWLSDLLLLSGIGSFKEDMKYYTSILSSDIPKTTRVLQEHWFKIRNKSESLGRIHNEIGPHKYILLMRKNKFEQAVSWYIAQNIHIWNYHDIPKYKLDEPLYLKKDMLLLYQMYKFLDLYRNYWLYELEESNLQYYPIWYEDLKENTCEELKKIFDYLNIEFNEKNINKIISKSKMKKLRWKETKDLVTQLKEYASKNNDSYFFYPNFKSSEPDMISQKINRNETHLFEFDHYRIKPDKTAFKKI